MGAIHRRKPLAFKHKIGKHDRSFFIRLLSFPIPGYQAHLRILKYREVKVDSLFCTTSNISYKHDRWDNKGPLFSFGIGKNELPCKSVLVLHPAEAFAERVLV